MKLPLLLYISLLAISFHQLYYFSIPNANGTSKCLKSESEVAQSCPTVCNPMDYSPPGSSIHGIFKARMLEWVAISFSKGSSWPRDRSQVSRIVADALLYRSSHQQLFRICLIFSKVFTYLFSFPRSNCPLYICYRCATVPKNSGF